MRFTAHEGWSAKRSMIQKRTATMSVGVVTAPVPASLGITVRQLRLLLRTVALFAGVALLTAVIAEVRPRVWPQPATQGAELTAVRAAAPSTVAAAASVTAEGSSLLYKSGATSVRLHREATGGIDVSNASGSVFNVGLRAAERSSDAAVVSAGIAQFETNDGAVTMPVLRSDGSVSVNTIMQHAGAPLAYTYPLTAPGGSLLTLRVDGGVELVGTDGVALATMPPPWAKDARGRAVSTHYEVKGMSLTQVVEHRDPKVVYPVVADPWFWNYMGCILGIGVPVGAAVVIASLPATWYWINRLATGTVMSGRVNGLMMYASWVRARCGAFIRS